MRSHLAVIRPLGLGFALLGAACSPKAEAPATPKPAAPVTAAVTAPASAATPAPASAAAHADHAPVGVKPGSHEDWCGEHGVAESQCTRCNPDLVAAFKATGDWCPEHGLPESQCLKCNPDLKIERPAKATN